MSGDIVLGYDGSDGAKAALKAALTVAKAFNTTLVLAFGYEVSPFGGEVADYQDRVEAIGKEALAEGVAAAAAIDPSVKVESLVVADRPADSLLNVAQSRQARIIVVGGNGSRPLVGAILGSVPHKLLHRSTVPVLVVPAPHE